MTIAIIGAGMAGLSCALRFQAGGHDVQIFDKGRGPGGRMSTRRMETPLGEMRWDHGAQFFTARDEGFRTVIEDWKRSGVVAEWEGRFLELGASGSSAPPKDDARYVGTPGMNGVIRHMAAPFDVQWSRRAQKIEGTPGQWQINFEDGSAEGAFDAVIIAVPAEQAVDLLEAPAPALARAAAGVTSAPCWAVLLAYDKPMDAGFDGVKLSGSPLSWIARNASKPGRDNGEAWILHAAPDWSRENVDEQKEEVAAKLIRNFRAMTDAPDPIFSAAHRWLYAMVEVGTGSQFGWDAGARIGACGDWHIAPRVEAAWISGHALAAEIAESP